MTKDNGNEVRNFTRSLTLRHELAVVPLVSRNSYPDAAVILGIIGNAEDVAALEAALVHDEVLVREHAACALAGASQGGEPDFLITIVRMPTAVLRADRSAVSTAGRATIA